MVHTKASPEHPPLPDDLQVYNMQIAGHRFNSRHESDRMCLLQNPRRNLVLKPFQRHPRGERERIFYETVWCSSDNKDLPPHGPATQSGSRTKVPVITLNKEAMPMDSVMVPDDALQELRQYIPQYHGTIDVPQCDKKTKRSSIRYLQLEDLTKDYIRPCVLDVKVGRQTWDPDASPTKVHYESNKYPPLQNLGFRFVGMKHYNTDKGAYKTYDKKWGLSLSEANVIENLTLFFGVGRRPDDVVIIESLIDKLRRIETWFTAYQCFNFYSSSILIIFESFNPNEQDQMQLAPASLVPISTATASSDDGEDSCFSSCSALSSEASQPDCPASGNGSAISVQGQKSISLDAVIHSEVEGTKRSTLGGKRAAKEELDEKYASPRKDQSATASNNANAVPAIPKPKSLKVDASAAPPQLAAVQRETDLDCLDDSDYTDCQEAVVKMARLDARMIDFSHTYPSDVEDVNYLHGLRRFIQCLEVVIGKREPPQERPMTYAEGAVATTQRRTSGSIPPDTEDDGEGCLDQVAEKRNPLPAGDQVCDRAVMQSYSVEIASNTVMQMSSDGNAGSTTIQGYSAARYDGRSTCVDELLVMHQSTLSERQQDGTSKMVSTKNGLPLSSLRAEQRSDRPPGRHDSQTHKHSPNSKEQQQPQKGPLMSRSANIAATSATPAQSSSINAACEAVRKHRSRSPKCSQSARRHSSAISAVKSNLSAPVVTLTAE